MLFKLAFYALLMYWLFKATGNLIRAILRDASGDKGSSTQENVYTIRTPRRPGSEHGSDGRDAEDVRYKDL
ncbi:MAG: hypothetical protein EB075_04060 [Bacteroidetes bacterium]|nr:hypothetical protein [Bacteroidota bacterium]